MRNLYAGIDIGTYHIKVVLAAPIESSEGPLRIVGTGSAAAKGIRNGYIVSAKEAGRAIQEAVVRAAQGQTLQVKRARIALGGLGLDEVRSTGDVTLTASGGVVTERDIARALEESQKRAGSKLTNRTILHTIPLEFRVDGTKVEGRPNGLQGTKLAVDALLVSILTQHYDDAIEATESAGIEVEHVVASPFAAASVTLSRAQEAAGVCLANMGSETTSLIVYDNGIPVSVKVLPIGASSITNGIALSFQMPLHEAEQLKRGAVTGSDIAPKKLRAVVQAKLKQIFSQVNAHLKSIGREKLLPAGIILTGGGSAVPDILDVARATLKLPSQIGLPSHTPRTGTLDVSWAVAYGLCRIAYLEDKGEKAPSMGDVLRRTGEGLRGFFKGLLP